MLTSLVLTLALAQIALPILLFVIRDRLIFLPAARPSPQEGLTLLRGRARVDQVEIRRSDGRVLAAYDAWPLQREAAAPVVLFLHGNGGNIGGRATLLEDFVAGTGLRTLMLDYSGYGGNAGSPSEDEAYEDATAALDWLAGQGVEEGSIVLYGESLGAAVALGVAERRDCAGVVAQSAFASLSSMALELYPWLPLVGLLARGSFPSERRARALEVPLLVVHGEVDRIVPVSQGRRLHAAAPPSTRLLIVEGAGHNDLFSSAGPDYLEDLGALFRSWGRREEGHGSAAGS
jgi:fermentation-respiration switch protein FrsA (DUF1100 family)